MEFEKDFAHLKTIEFDYNLPDDKIARYPLPRRDHSKLLIWQSGTINHEQFFNLSEFLNSDDVVVFNNTKVIPARIHFQKSSGAWIELLVTHEIIGPENDSLHQNERVVECMVGNKKKWSGDEVLLIQNAEGNFQLEARWNDREKNQILLSWKPENQSFFEILSQLGEMPIPPYLNRESEESDKENYQTIYARNHGAIAAPTAGLHFTPQVLESLDKKGISRLELTLHVGLGTFKPMKAEAVAEHEMHEEEVIIPIAIIEKFAQTKGRLVAVGTTSMRSLESLFWIGLIWKGTGMLSTMLETNHPYHWAETTETTPELLQWMVRNMRETGLSELRFFTRLYLVPGYRFRVVQGLITNFHQPKSTLLVLISAFTGNAWKQIYAEAMEKNYRFLSYGDSSLLLP